MIGDGDIMKIPHKALCLFLCMLLSICLCACTEKDQTGNTDNTGASEKQSGLIPAVLKGFLYIFIDNCGTIKIIR